MHKHELHSGAPKFAQQQLELYRLSVYWFDVLFLWTIKKYLWYVNGWTFLYNKKKILGKFISQRNSIDSFIDMNILSVGFISLNYFFTFRTIHSHTHTNMGSKVFVIKLIGMMTLFIDFEFRIKLGILQWKRIPHQ